MIGHLTHIWSRVETTWPKEYDIMHKRMGWTVISNVRKHAAEKLRLSMVVHGAPESGVCDGQ